MHSTQCIRETAKKKEGDCRAVDRYAWLRSRYAPTTTASKLTLSDKRLLKRDLQNATAVV